MKNNIIINKLHLHAKDIIAIFCLLIFTMIFFWRGIFADKVTLVWDSADYFYPIMTYNGACIREGMLPLWNPYLFGGHPNFADPQAQIFYPITWMLGLFSPVTPKVIYCFLAFHYFLAGAFMYLLCRYLGRQLYSSLIAAVCFMFSGFMIGHFQHVPIIFSVAYLPLSFLLLDRSLTEKKFAAGLIGALVTSIAILAGHPQTSFYMFVVLGIHWIYKTIALARDDFSNALFCLKAGIVFFGFAVLIAMVQIIPTYEFMQISNRSAKIPLEEAGRGLSFMNMVTSLIPNYYSGMAKEGYHAWGFSIDRSQQNLYMGIFPLILAIWGLWGGQDRRKFYFLVMAFLGLVISLGIKTPIFALCYKLFPGFSSFRQSVHFIFVYHFFLAILAGAGFEALCNDQTKLKPALGFLIAFLIFILLYYSLLPKSPRSGTLSTVPVSGLYWMLLFFFLSALVFIFNSSINDKKVHWFRIGAVILAFIDIYFVTSSSVTLGMTFDNETHQTQHQRLASSIGAGKLINNHEGFENKIETGNLTNIGGDQGSKFFRTYVSRHDTPFSAPRDTALLNYLGFNRTILYGLFLVDGYSPMVLKRHVELTQYVGEKSVHRLMQLFNTKYYIKVGSKTAISLIEQSLRRAMLVGNVQFESDSQKVLETIADPYFDPLNTIVVEAEGNYDSTSITPQGHLDTSMDTVTLNYYSPNSFECETYTEKPKFLFVGDTYYPGWQAYIDGKKTRIFRANYNFRAIQVPSGRHTVTFLFKPLSLKIGAGVSILSLILIGCILLITYRFDSIKKQFRRK